MSDITPRLDQAQSHLVVLAETWGLMHKKLIELEVPEETARQIIVNWVHNSTNTQDQE